MEFIDIATEQTTAVTDLVLALVALVALFSLQQYRKTDQWRAWLWRLIFGLLAIAAILGTIVHGFKMSQPLNELLWRPLNLSLGLMVSVFIVAVIYEICGRSLARKIMPFVIGIGIVFFAVTLIWPDRFIVFIIYEAVATVFALVGYLWLTLIKKSPGAWLMTSGVFLTMIAAGVQASQAIRLSLIWEFDHNGVFHMIQIVAVYIFLLGLRSAFVNQEHDSITPL